MLGLGNAINKARRRTVFVSVAPDQPEFEVLAFGSLGEAGYVVKWRRVNDSGDPDENGNNIKYSEVYPAHYTFPEDQSKASLSVAGPDVNSHILVNEGKESSSEYTGWRFAEPNEFDSFIEHIYSDPAFEGLYQEGNPENPYVVVGNQFFDSWANNIPPFQDIVTSNGWNFRYTNGDTSTVPSVEQLNEGSYYFLVVRTFTKEISFNTATTPPPLSPDPIDPEPASFQFRGSDGLLPAVFNSDYDDSINFSLTGDLLQDGDFPMYIANPTSVMDTSDDADGNRFKLQFTLKFPVDPSNPNNAFSLPDPWSPSNSEQKRMRISMLNLGYKDIPFYSPNPSTEDIFNEFGLTGMLDFLETDYHERRYPNIEVLLNKTAQADIPIGSSKIAVDGYVLDASTNEAFFSYTGYLDVRDFMAKNLVSTYDETVKVKDLTEPTILGAWASEKRFFMLRVESVEYGTTNRPYSELQALPQSMRYIMFPLLPQNNAKTFFNLSDYSDFIDAVWSSSGQSLPPEIPGQTEDYYN
jgi:hypothetical protein